MFPKNVCFDPDKGGNGGGGEPKETPPPASDDFDAERDKLRKAIDNERSQTKSAKAELESVREALRKAEAERAERDRALLKALGQDDGSDDPDSLRKALEAQKTRSDELEQQLRLRQVRDEFARAVGSVHDLDTAFTVSGLGADADSESITKAVESLKESKSFLFVSDNGDSSAPPNPGAKGPTKKGQQSRTYTVDEYSQITTSPEYQAQSRAKSGELWEEMKAAVREDRIVRN